MGIFDRKMPVDPVASFFAEARHNGANLPSGAQCEVDMYKYFTPEEAPVRLLDLLLAAESHGFFIVDGSTRQIVLGKL